MSLYPHLSAVISLKTSMKTAAIILLSCSAVASGLWGVESLSEGEAFQGFSKNIKEFMTNTEEGLEVKSSSRLCRVSPDVKKGLSSEWIDSEAVVRYETKTTLDVKGRFRVESHISKPGNNKEILAKDISTFDGEKSYVLNALWQRLLVSSGKPIVSEFVLWENPVGQLISSFRPVKFGESPSDRMNDYFGESVNEGTGALALQTEMQWIVESDAVIEGKRTLALIFKMKDSKFGPVGMTLYYTNDMRSLPNEILIRDRRIIPQHLVKLTPDYMGTPAKKKMNPKTECCEITRYTFGYSKIIERGLLPSSCSVLRFEYFRPVAEDRELINSAYDGEPFDGGLRFIVEKRKMEISGVESVPVDDFSFSISPELAKSVSEVK